VASCLFKFWLYIITKLLRVLLDFRRLYNNTGVYIFEKNFAAWYMYFGVRRKNKKRKRKGRKCERKSKKRKDNRKVEVEW
jgi:hypothetical protein